jgi:hypothetical protein
VREGRYMERSSMGACEKLPGEEAEWERDNLRQELHALREARESPQTVEEKPESQSLTLLREGLRGRTAAVAKPVA